MLFANIHFFFLDVSHGDIRRLEVCLFDYIFLHKFISLLTQILAETFCSPAGSARLSSELFDEFWSPSLVTFAIHPLLEVYLSYCLVVCQGACLPRFEHYLLKYVCVCLHEFMHAMCVQDPVEARRGRRVSAGNWASARAMCTFDC